MSSRNYKTNVFINCPFDAEYNDFLQAIIFTIHDCGYRPRCAREEDDGGNVRFDKIQNIISECKFGIHDISRTELDDENGLPRFNMPFELGLFLGAKRFGGTAQRTKNSLILDIEQFRYQKYLSDIAGCDIKEHKNDVGKLIKAIRDWLNDATSGKTIPGGTTIKNRFGKFKQDLPMICKVASIEEDEMTYSDYVNFIVDWLITNTR